MLCKMATKEEEEEEEEVVEVEAIKILEAEVEQ